MRKNIAGQIVGAQIALAAGGDFTGSASVFVTKDGGTQTAGGGGVTHKGNGYHSYTPTQAETDAAHIAFTFTGSLANTETIQEYTVDAEIWDRIVSKANHNIAQSAGVLLRKGSRIVAAEGTVDDAAATTTVFKTDLTEVDSFWSDALLTFTSGALTGQSSPILSYTQLNGEITLDEALTSAPADTDEFDIFADHIHPVSQIVTGVLTTQMTEAYAADGVEPTLAQAMFFMQQYLIERGVAGTVGTVRKLDKTTTAATFDLDDDTNPTDTTRAS